MLHNPYLLELGCQNWKKKRWFSLKTLSFYVGKIGSIRFGYLSDTTSKVKVTYDQYLQNNTATGCFH